MSGSRSCGSDYGDEAGGQDGRVGGAGDLRGAVGSHGDREPQKDFGRGSSPRNARNDYVKLAGEGVKVCEHWSGKGQVPSNFCLHMKRLYSCLGDQDIPETLLPTCLADSRMSTDSCGQGKQLCGGEGGGGW
eukprot:768640-Hanusia_phi.AAC.7